MTNEKLSDHYRSLMGDVNSGESLVEQFLKGVKVQNPEQEFLEKILNNSKKKGDISQILAKFKTKSNPASQEATSKPAYQPKYRLSTRAWDANVEVVKILSEKKEELESRISSLEEQIDKNEFEIKNLTQKIEKLEKSDWRSKLIDLVHLHKLLTGLALIFGIVFFLYKIL